MSEQTFSMVITALVVGGLSTITNFFILKFLGNKDTKVRLELLSREIKVLVRSLARMNGWGKEFKQVYEEEWKTYDDFDNRREQIRDSL